MAFFEYWSCGANENGSHGNGSDKDIEVATKMKYVSHKLKINGITSGRNGSTYMISDDNKLIVCGDNAFGQLGIKYCDKDHGFTDLRAQWIPLIIEWWNYPHSFPPELTGLIYKFALDNDSNIDRLIFEERNYSLRHLTSLLYPIIVNNFEIKHISQGIEANHAFIITLQNEIYGAGDNEWNKISNKAFDTKSYFTNIKTAKFICWTKINYFNKADINIKQIVCSYSYTIFLSDNGKLYCQGASHKGSLGLGSESNWTKKQILKIDVDAHIKYVACGKNHNLALTNEGRVLYWGMINGIYCTQNKRVTWGQEAYWKPKEIEYFTEFEIEIVKIQCGSLHNVCLDNHGRIYTWGNNVYNQCGIITEYGKIDDPCKLENGSLKDINVCDIKCGRYHNVCKTEDGDFYLWGSNFYNECLVERDGIFVTTPTKYDTKLDVYDMYPGYHSTFVSVLT